MLMNMSFMITLALQLCSTTVFDLWPWHVGHFLIEFLLDFCWAPLNGPDIELVKSYDWKQSLDVVLFMDRSLSLVSPSAFTYVQTTAIWSLLERSGVMPAETLNMLASLIPSTVLRLTPTANNWIISCCDSGALYVTWYGRNRLLIIHLSSKGQYHATKTTNRQKFPCSLLPFPRNAMSWRVNVLIMSSKILRTFWILAFRATLSTKASTWHKSSHMRSEQLYDFLNWNALRVCPFWPNLCSSSYSMLKRQFKTKLDPVRVFWTRNRWNRTLHPCLCYIQGVEIRYNS